MLRDAAVIVPGVDIVIDAADIGRAARWPAPLDLRELLSRDPAAPLMLIDDWLPAGYATLIAGHGGSGKSSIALGLAASIATGRAWFGLPVSRRRVIYLSCEDRADVLHWRLVRSVEQSGIGVDDLAGQLHFLDLVGCDSVIWQRDPSTGISATPAYAALRAAVEVCRAEVLIVDGVADTFGGSENDRGEIKRFVNALVSFIPRDGAVILIHHVNRATAGYGATTEGYSGSTGWHNSVRARWYLRPETERTDDGIEPTGDLLLELQKSNLGRADRSMRFRWDQHAHMFVGEPVAISRTDTSARDAAEQDAIVSAIRDVEARGDHVPAATQGPRTAFHVLDATGLLSPELRTKPARKRFWRHVEVLRRIGTVRESSIRRANRHGVVILTLKAAPGNDCAALSHSDITHAAQSDAGATAPYASHTHGGIRGRARTTEPLADDEVIL